MISPMEGAAIIKAPGCPHYVLRPAFEAWHQVLGPHAAELMRCQRCMTEPVKVFGQFDRPGPRSGPRVQRRLNQRDYLARRLT